MEIIVTADGLMQVGVYTYKCAIGRGGFVREKHEGDGGTPIGAYYLKRVYYRPDKLNEPKTALPTQALTHNDGWCDDPNHASYNRMVSLPFDASHEKMWRDDGLYDVVIEINHNDNPPIPGEGSAIFLHIAKPEYDPTEGCIALAQSDLLKVLETASTATKIIVQD